MTQEELSTELGTCQECGHALLSNLREVAETIVTYDVDLTAHASDLLWSNQEVFGEGEKHLWYECSFCGTRVTGEQEGLIAELIAA